MYVDMVVHPCTGSLSQVYADIEPLRGGRILQDVAAEANCCEEIEHFVGREIIHVGGVPERGDHQMTVRIRVPI